MLRQRTCIGCRSKREKRSMLRLCRTSEGDVRIDISGKRPGRGAYVCSRECLDQALRKNLVGRALKTRFTGDLEDAEKAAINAYFSETDRESCKE